MLHATGIKLENGREKRRKTHEAEANLPHRKNGEATGKQQRRMEENGKFRTRGKAYHKPFLFARFVGFGFQKGGFVFEGRMTDSRMMKYGFSILFVAAIVLLAGVVRASTVRNGFFVFRLRLGTHCHAGTGFSRDSPPDWEKRFPFAYFRVRDATNMRMNPALSVWLAIPGDPAWDNAAAQNLFSGRNRKRLHFRGIAKGQSSGKSRCGLIGWLFAANANGVQCLDFSHPFPRAVTARAGSRHDSLFIPRDNLFNWDFPASIAEAA